jgi:hypothetical protein
MRHPALCNVILQFVMSSRMAFCTPEEGAHRPCWPNRLIIILLLCYCQQHKSMDAACGHRSTQYMQQAAAELHSSSFVKHQAAADSAIALMDTFYERDRDLIRMNTRIQP